MRKRIKQRKEKNKKGVNIMALTNEQRDDKTNEFRLGDSTIRENGTPTGDLWRALQKRAATSPGTPERAEVDKMVSVAEAVAGY